MNNYDKYSMSRLGSQKTNMINVIRKSLKIIETLFPSLFNTDDDKDHPDDNQVNHRNYNFLVQNDTELGLTKTLAYRVCVHIFSSLLDISHDNANRMTSDACAFENHI